MAADAKNGILQDQTDVSVLEALVRDMERLGRLIAGGEATESMVQTYAQCAKKRGRSLPTGGGAPAPQPAQPNGGLWNGAALRALADNLRSASNANDAAGTPSLPAQNS